MTSQDKATSRAESGEALKSMESMMRPETVVQAKKEAAEILAESAPGWELWDAIDALPMVDGRVELGAVQKILLASRPAESAKTVPMEMLALLSCPFCGGRAERIDLDDDETDPNYGGSFIHCPACLASSKLIFGEKVGLEEAWNKRFASSAKGDADELHRAICALNENMPLGLEWAMDIVRDTLLAARRPSAEPVCPECGIKLPGHFYTCSKAPWGKDGES